MILGSFYFKQKAKEALKGNWQTALLITFFSGLFMTVSSLLESAAFPDVLAYVGSGAFDRLYAEWARIPSGTWTAFYILNLLSFLLSPMLALGCNHYFVRRLKGEELGFAGLFSRARCFLKALWLYVYMGVRVFLWSLLLIVPGVIAAIRYSMAPYYLAEDPGLSAGEAIEKSKNAMKDLKLSYFVLMLSFYGWIILAMIAQMLLASISMIVALVAAQFMQLAISTYMNGACASFYLTVSSPEGMDAAKSEMSSRLQQMGMDGAPYDGGRRDDRPHDGAEEGRGEDSGKSDDN